MDTPVFTVTKHGNHFKLTVSTLPGKTFGPWNFPETIGQLQVAALMTPMEARNLVMEAGATGSATYEMEH